MPEPDPSPLFRREAVDEQRDRWLGSALVTPPPSQMVIVGVKLVSIDRETIVTITLPKAA